MFYLFSLYVLHLHLYYIVQDLFDALDDCLLLFRRDQSGSASLTLIFQGSIVKDDVTTSKIRPDKEYRILNVSFGIILMSA